MHTSPATNQPDAPTLDPHLEHALTACIVAPALPEGFRSHVLAVVLTEQLQSLQHRQEQMEAEYAREMARLKKGHVVLRRDALILVAGSACAAGACAQMVLPWLSSQLELSNTLTGTLIAMVIGLAAGASIWRERFGAPGTLLGMLRV